MDLYAAVDLRGGRSVRLIEGDLDRQTTYGDPLAAAVGLAEGGAPWLHVVDLDAAMTGRPVNRAVLVEIVAAVSVPVQAGGGLRDEGSAEELLDLGVARVVLGTAAVSDPGLVTRLARRHPGRVAVGLDHRSGELAVRGWVEAGGLQLSDALRRFEDAGTAAVVVTEIGRDGTLAGPDLAGLRSTLGATAVPVIASGGVGSARDLAGLASLREGDRSLAGVVVGKALHDGVLDLKEALAACTTSE